MAHLRPLVHEADWQRLWQAGGRLLVFKHSTTCPISARAYAEVRRWAEGLPEEAAIYLVRVREERPVSARVARDTGVEHQSPQALLVEGERVLWHASHGWITQAALEQAWRDPQRAISRSTSLAEAVAQGRAGG